MMEESGRQEWAIGPPKSIDKGRGLRLADKISYLFVGERWAYLPHIGPDPICIQWKYQFSRPDGGAYRGSMEWVFRYDFNARSVTENPDEIIPHLNIHHPDPIGDHIHYPAQAEMWGPTEFTAFLLRHFPSIGRS